MPVLKTEEEFWDTIYEINNVTDHLEDTEICYKAPGEPIILTGQTLDKERNIWIDPYTKEGLTNEYITNQLDASQPCALIWGRELRPYSCEGKLTCGYCRLEQESNRFLMKGVCDTNLYEKYDYDLNYYVHGLKNGKLYFKGLTNSHIYFDGDKKRWILESLR